jgi:hypothetical protein
VTSKDRQARHKAALAEQGLVQINGWVRPHQAARLKLLLRALRENEHLEVGPAIDAVSRRFVKFD